MSDNELCVQAIRTIEPGSGIPANLLGAIGRVETGKVDARDGNTKAWPWSVNAEGRGTLFASKLEAIAAVVALQQRGVASIDVGCMQVNLMYHAGAFATLDEAFDPMANVRYAAVFLRALHAEAADWSLAAAYYHSRNPDRALAYQQKVMASLPGANRLQVASVPSSALPQSALQNAWAATVPADGIAGDGRSTPGWTAMQPVSGRRFGAGAIRATARYVAR